MLGLYTLHEYGIVACFSCFIIAARTHDFTHLNRRGLKFMGALEFGTYDNFAAYEMKGSAVAADVYEQHIKEVQEAEELGYKYYFIIEHQNSDVGQLTAPSVYLSAVAQRTSTIRFGVMIYQLPFYNPIRLAEEAAMLDQLSRGRLEFGTGIGVAEHEFVRWNLPFDERRQMAQEALEIIIKAWTEDTVTYQGDYWQFDEALPVPKPYQSPHPPVWVAAHSPASLEFAAKGKLSRFSEFRRGQRNRRKVRTLPPHLAGLPAPGADAPNLFDPRRARGGNG